VELDYKLSTLVARLTGARPNHCWKNAWQALIELPQLFLEGRYVEGWAVFEPGDAVCVLEHGWATLPAERGVVDPTIVLLVDRRHPVAYFPGLAYTWTETLAFQGQPLPRVLETGGGGVHADYGSAFCQAMAHATRLAGASPAPRRVIVQAASPGAAEEVQSGEGEQLKYAVRIVSSAALGAGPWHAAAQEE
jgi:hypothetical protein